MSNISHRLRCFAKSSSEHYITDVELDEVLTLIDYDAYRDYEFSSNFIFTKDADEFENATREMCCGIVTRQLVLADTTIIYFGFDYGH